MQLSRDDGWSCRRSGSLAWTGAAGLCACHSCLVEAGASQTLMTLQGVSSLGGSKCARGGNPGLWEQWELLEAGDKARLVIWVTNAHPACVCVCARSPALQLSCTCVCLCAPTNLTWSAVCSLTALLGQVYGEFTPSLHYFDTPVVLTPSKAASYLHKNSCCLTGSALVFWHPRSELAATRELSSLPACIVMSQLEAGSSRLQAPDPLLSPPPKSRPSEAWPMWLGSGALLCCSRAALCFAGTEPGLQCLEGVQEEEKCE